VDGLPRLSGIESGCSRHLLGVTAGWARRTAHKGRVKPAHALCRAAMQRLTADVGAARAGAACVVGTALIALRMAILCLLTRSGAEQGAAAAAAAQAAARGAGHGASKADGRRG